MRQYPRSFVSAYIESERGTKSPAPGLLISIIFLPNFNREQADDNNRSLFISTLWFVDYPSFTSLIHSRKSKFLILIFWQEVLCCE